MDFTTRCNVGDSTFVVMLRVYQEKNGNPIKFELIDITFLEGNPRYNLIKVVGDITSIISRTLKF